MTPKGEAGRLVSVERLTSIATAISLVAMFTTMVNRVTIGRLSESSINPSSRGPLAVCEMLTVCIPARNERDTLPELLDDLIRQIDCPTMQVLIYDDDSTDGTADAARSTTHLDPRFRVIEGKNGPPAGWTGKAAACAVLSSAARERCGVTDEGIIVFLDADVRIEPWALAAAADQLRCADVSLLSPWPFQEAVGFTERMLQPLLCWTWMASVPVAIANRSSAPSLAVACGQFMMFDAAAYFQIGGHGAVAISATEDLAIARSIRRAGYRTSVIAGGDAVRCRMYTGPKPLFDGYVRWLWSVTSGSSGKFAAAAVLTSAFVVPPLAAVFGRGLTQRWGVLGWAAAATSRYVARRSEGSSGPRIGDSLISAAHPVSAVGFAVLSSASYVTRRHGTLVWKGRPLVRSTPRPRDNI